MKIKSLFTILCLLILRILLDFSYINIINPLFGYEGLMLSINTSKILESYLLFIITSTVVVICLEEEFKPSKIVIYILVLFLYLPITSLFWLQDQPRIFVFFITGSIMFMSLAVAMLPKIHLKIWTEGKKLTNIFVIFMTVFVYGILILQGGLGRINLNLLDVYEVRASYSNTANPILGYLLPWQAYGINMLLLAMALHKKKYFRVLMVILMQIFLFSMTNFKSFLFSPILLVTFYFFSKTNLKNNLLLVMSTGSLLVATISIWVYKMSSDIMMVSLFIRRQFYVPANLHFIYYDFFERIDKYYLSHSIFSLFLDNEYYLNPVKLVAFQYFGKDFAPNVGFYGDAFLNFGLFGIFVFTLCMTIVLKIIDSVTLKVPNYLAISIIVIPAMALVNSAFLTSLFTHGILFSIILLWLGNSYFVNEENKE